MSTSQECTPFHTFEWAKALRQAFPHLTSVYWGLWLNDELIAIWPTSLLRTLGARVFNPLPNTHTYVAQAPAMKYGFDMTLLHAVADYVTQFMRRYRVSQWSFDIARSSPLVEAAVPLGFQIRPSSNCGFIFDTSVDPQILWKKFPHGGARTGVRKAEREGVEVKETQHLDDLKEYFKVRAATFWTPEKIRREMEMHLRFCELIHEYLIRQGKARLFVAKHENRIVGGSLVLSQNDRWYLWSATTLRDMWRLRANDILIWQTIQCAHRSGINTLDVGRAPVSHTGVNYFITRNLSGYRQVKLVVLTLPINKIWNQCATSFFQIWERLNERGLVPSALAYWLSRRGAGLGVS